ncbi:unnamed protein product [Timema podura]|uniref:Uncharacterized protein n=1 Tax=Timema podura TaxID=61482 RepID=A0ABN7PPW6_TIMPD|nr:unnamed protein product [Timema podura]
MNYEKEKERVNNMLFEVDINSSESLIIPQHSSAIIQKVTVKVLVYKNKTKQKAISEYSYKHFNTFKIVS